MILFITGRTQLTKFNKYLKDFWIGKKNKLGRRKPNQCTEK